MGARVDSLLRQVEAEVAAIPEESARALAPILAAARREVVADVKRWLARVDDIDSPFRAMQYRRSMAQLDRALTVLREELPGEVERVLGVRGRAASALAIEHLERELAFFAGDSIPLPFQQAALIARGDRLLVRRYERSLRHYGEDGVDGIRRQLAIGVARNETWWQMAARIARVPAVQTEAARAAMFSRMGDLVGQRMWAATGAEWRAFRIARTEGIYAYNAIASEGIRELERDDPGWKQRWDAAYDGRVCAICKSLDEQTVAVGQNFIDVTGDSYDHPPAHPNCFPAGTRITTRRGLIPIEQVRIGDVVLTARARWRGVRALSRRPYAGPVVIVSSWDERQVVSTPNHPFRMASGIWAAADKLVGAERMVVALNGLESLCWISATARVGAHEGEVFNFQVDEDESYVAEGFAVHNCRCAVVAWRPEWAADRRAA